MLMMLAAGCGAVGRLLQLMLMMLDAGRGLWESLAADADDAGGWPRGCGKALAADADDAGCWLGAVGEPCS